MSYPIGRAYLGHLEKRVVNTVTIPRKVFLKLVDQTLESTIADDDLRWRLRDQLMPVAETMDRFPMGTWLDSHRACGCVVGEYLVARQALARVDAPRLNRDLDVFTILKGQPDGAALWRFGNDIDSALNDHMLEVLGRKQWEELVCAPYDLELDYSLDLVVLFDDWERTSAPDAGAFEVSA